MAQEQSKGFTQVAAYNEGALKLRLDTSQLLKDLELFLRGEIISVTRDSETGKIKTEKKKIGERKANDSGIQDIMNKISAIINPAVVQGNFKEEMYYDYIYNIEMEILKLLWVNMYIYAIQEEDIDTIKDFIVSLVIPFISRLIDNKERESYAQTIRHSESTTTGDKKGPFGLF